MDFRSFSHGVKRSQASNAFIIRDNLCESVVELRLLAVELRMLSQFSCRSG